MNWNKGNPGSSGNIFVTSNNQSGGITAHTVNLGPPARQMNQQLGQHLQQHIPKPAKVTVVAVMGDSEAFGFANQVLAWLRTAGYTNLHGVDQAVFGEPVTGQSMNRINDTDYELVIGSRQ